MVQPPSSKITASMVAGALTVIIVAEAQRRGYPIDGTEGASISVVLSAIAGYLMPHSQAQAPGSPAAKESSLDRARLSDAGSAGSGTSSTTFSSVASSKSCSGESSSSSKPSLKKELVRCLE